DSVVDFSRICGKFTLTMGVLCLTLEEFLQPAAERVLSFLGLATAGLFHIRATSGTHHFR
ncbi:hypothetical protein ACV966_005085, partial [Escherichia coli]